MSPLYPIAAGLVTFWLHVTLAPHVALFGVQPNLLLITVVILGLRWVHPAYFVFAALAGVAQDTFSHGLLGVYGVSFLLTGVLANMAGKLIFEHNLVFVGSVVWALTLAEGFLALALLQILGSETAWLTWFFGRVLPRSLYHAALAPVIYILLRRLERALPQRTSK